MSKMLNKEDTKNKHANDMSTVIKGFSRMALDAVCLSDETNRPPIGGFNLVSNKAEMIKYMKKTVGYTVCQTKYDLSEQQLNSAEFRNVMADALEKISASLRVGCLPWQKSFLNQMLTNDSGSTQVLSSFLTLYETWLLSKTSRANAQSLGHHVHRGVVSIMRKGAPMFYYCDYEWHLAYVACVIYLGDKKYAYHMTLVGTTFTTTLFDHNVAEYTSTSSTIPDYTPNPITIRYGNIGSLTAHQPHNLGVDGFHSICYLIPDEFKSTAPHTCCIPTSAATSHITVADFGTILDLQPMLMFKPHEDAIEMLNDMHPYVPVNFPQGYSDEAIIAITNYINTREYAETSGGINYNWYDLDNKQHYDYGRFSNPMKILIEDSIEALYTSMPFITRPDTPERKEDSYDRDMVDDYVCTYPQSNCDQSGFVSPWIPLPDAWSPGEPNPHSFHYLDDRSGNWISGGFATPEDRYINWNDQHITNNIESDENDTFDIGSDDGRDHREY
jgi:hypothetical protein